jgi:hypothetical protein
MRYHSIILLTLSASTSALNIWTRETKSCPSVWSDIASELQSDFAGCGRDAHSAIRAPFHDCINNGCDGSLILSDECSRPENAGLSGICTKLADWATKYDVSSADIIQFAAATAISQCPLGPKVQALVGRKDSKKAADAGSVPSSRDSIDKILGAFSAKGFSAKDVVALMGTHSVAVQLNDDPAQAGKSLDSTPSVYDMTFYKETKDGTAPYSLQSDRLLSNSSQVSTSSYLGPPISQSSPFLIITLDEGQSTLLTSIYRLQTHGPLSPTTQRPGTPSSQTRGTVSRLSAIKLTSYKTALV